MLGWVKKSDEGFSHFYSGETSICTLSSLLNVSKYSEKEAPFCKVCMGILKSRNGEKIQREHEKFKFSLDDAEKKYKIHPEDSVKNYVEWFEPADIKETSKIIKSNYKVDGISCIFSAIINKKISINEFGKLEKYVSY